MIDSRALKGTQILLAINIHINNNSCLYQIKKKMEETIDIPISSSNAISDSNKMTFDDENYQPKKPSNEKEKNHQVLTENNSSKFHKFLIFWSLILAFSFCYLSLRPGKTRIMPPVFGERIIFKKPEKLIRMGSDQTKEDLQVQDSIRTTNNFKTVEKLTTKKIIPIDSTRATTTKKKEMTNPSEAKVTTTSAIPIDSVHVTTTGVVKEESTKIKNETVTQINNNTTVINDNFQALSPEKLKNLKRDEMLAYNPKIKDYPDGLNLSDILSVIVLSGRANFDARHSIRLTWKKDLDNVYFIIGDQGCPVPTNLRKDRLGCTLDSSKSITKDEELRYNSSMLMIEKQLNDEMETFGDIVKDLGGL